jgi:hypothetical protein
MDFDFSAVGTPFRMQPGLRRLAPGAVQLTPLAPGSRHQREKLAVLSAFTSQALLVRPGFDAVPALDALAAHAAAEHPQHFTWNGRRALSHTLRVAVADGQVEPLGAGEFGLGDEIGRCLLGLPSDWRLAGLLCLAFAEDFAVVDARDATIPWLAVCLPSNWAPEEKIGRHFAEVHAPVADNRLIVGASEALTRLVTGPERWERFVWTVTRHPRLHAHPARCDPQPWPEGPDADALAALAFFRTERQTFIPLPARREAVFTIGVEVRPLAQAIANPAHAQALHDAIASMSPAVLAYRSLVPARDRLLDWLAGRAAA